MICCHAVPAPAALGVHVVAGAVAEAKMRGEKQEQSVQVGIVTAAPVMQLTPSQRRWGAFCGSQAQPRRPSWSFGNQTANRWGTGDGLLQALPSYSSALCRLLLSSAAGDDKTEAPMG